MAATRGTAGGPVARIGDTQQSRGRTAHGSLRWWPAAAPAEIYLCVRPALVRTSTLPWAWVQRAAVSIRWPRVANFDPAVHLWYRRPTGEGILGMLPVHVKNGDYRTP